MHSNRRNQVFDEFLLKELYDKTRTKQSAIIARKSDDETGEENERAKDRSRSAKWSNAVKDVLVQTKDNEITICSFSYKTQNIKVQQTQTHSPVAI